MTLRGTLRCWWMMILELARIPYKGKKTKKKKVGLMRTQIMKLSCLSLLRPIRHGFHTLSMILRTG
jgi:hypothetical protein